MTACLRCLPILWLLLAACATTPTPPPNTGIEGQVLSALFGVLAVVVALRTLYRDVIQHEAPAEPAEAA